MSTPFEDYVNTELPQRIKADIPISGNLPAGNFMRTTGVGMKTEPIESAKITVSATAPSSPSVNDLWVDIS